MFMYNRVGPDIHQMVAVLSTRVKEPNETCCQNLVVMINYLNETKKNYLALSSDYLKLLNGMWTQVLRFTLISRFIPNRL